MNSEGEKHFSFVWYILIVIIAIFDLKVPLIGQEFTAI